MKKIIHKFESFVEAEKFDRRYYAKMSVEKRLSIVQELREMHLKLFISRKERSYANRKRLRRVSRVIQQTQG